MAWNENKRIKLTIDQTCIDAALSGFPIVVRLGAGVGKTGYDATAVFDELGANKKKIAVFAGGDQYTGKKCFVEIEQWDEVSEVAVLHVWVPEVDPDTDTVLWLYYDSTQDDQDVRTTAEASDDFTGSNGDPPDPHKWRVAEGGEGWSIQNNKLEVTTAGEVDELRTRYRVSGDFDFQVDYELVTYPSTNEWHVGLRIEKPDATGDLDQVLIERRYKDGHRYAYNYRDGGTWPSVTLTDTSDTSGKLRIRRSGSVIYADYWNGSSWTNMGSHDFGDTNSCVLRLLVNTSSVACIARYDNFTVNSAGSITGFVGDTGEVPAQEVWDSDFAAVYHLAQDPTGGSGCIKDSTRNVNYGTPANMESGDLVDGQIGKALSFNIDATGENIDCGAADSLKPTAQLTLEALVNVTEILTDDTNFILSRYRGSDNNRSYTIALNTSGKVVFLTSSDGTSAGNDAITDPDALGTGAWKYIAGAHNSAVGKELQVGTAIKASNTNLVSIFAGVANLRIASQNEPTPGGWFKGKVDEARLSQVFRSQAWRKATYYSLFDELITFTTNQPPSTPTISIDRIGGTFCRLNGSAFSDPDGDGHAASQWQIDLQGGDFSDPQYDSGETSAGEIQHEVTDLTQETDYKARVRYKDSSGDPDTQWSSWSTPTNFTTKGAWTGIQFPNKTPADGATQVQNGTPIKCDVTDNWYWFEEPDIKITVEGTQYTSADPETSYEDITDGKRITYTPGPDYGRGEEISVRVDAKNSNDDEAYVAWSFLSFRHVSSNAAQLSLTSRALSEAAAQLLDIYRAACAVAGSLMMQHRQGSAKEAQTSFSQDLKRQLQGEAEPTLFVCEIKRRMTGGAANVAEVDLLAGEGSANIYGAYLLVTGGDANIQAYSIWVRQAGSGDIQVTFVTEAQGQGNIGIPARIAGEGSARIFKVEGATYIRINALPAEIKTALEQAGVIINA